MPESLEAAWVKTVSDRLTKLDEQITALIDAVMGSHDASLILRVRDVEREIKSLTENTREYLRLYAQTRTDQEAVRVELSAHIAHYKLRETDILEALERLTRDLAAVDTCVAGGSRDAADRARIVDMRLADLEARSAARDKSDEEFRSNLRRLFWAVVTVAVIGALGITVGWIVVGAKAALVAPAAAPAAP